MEQHQEQGEDLLSQQEGQVYQWAEKEIVHTIVTITSSVSDSLYSLLYLTG